MPVVIDDAAAGKACVLTDDEFDFGGLLKRHGGVVEIPQADYDRLCQQHLCK